MMTNLKSSFAETAARFTADWTPRQVLQHRQVFEVALRAVEAFLTSPYAQGMHPDAVRFWNNERATFHRIALHLGGLRLSDAPSYPCCPKCGAVEFSSYPMGSAALRCAGCCTLWHSTDLSGERYEFLSKRFNQNPQGE